MPFSKVKTDPSVPDRDGSNPQIRPALTMGELSQRRGRADGGIPLLKYLFISLLALLVTVGAGFVGVRVFIGQGTLLVTSQPSEVRIFLDGEAKGVTTSGSLSISGIGAGTHDVAAQKEGYVPFSGKVSIAKNSTFNQSIRLSRLPDPIGRLDIMSRPSGASIFLDGRDTGKTTPDVVDDVVAAMPHSLSLKLEDYVEHVQELEVAADDTRRVEVELRARYVTALIQTEPAGAKVYRDGSRTLLGETPVKLTRLDPQGPPPKVTIRHPGCKTYSTTLALSEDEPEKVLSISLTCR